MRDRETAAARERIEEPFGWAKTIGGMAQTMYRGVERVRCRFILTMATDTHATNRDVNTSMFKVVSPYPKCYTAEQLFCITRAES